MKHKLIKTDNYLLVVDEDITKAKEGCWIIRNGIEPIFCKEYFFFDFKEPYRKIIAHLPLNNAPILEGVPLLPPLEDDFIELAKKYGISIGDKAGTSAFDFMRGYDKAKKKYKYTEVDLFKMSCLVEKTVIENGGLTPSKYDEFVQSLQQPKYPVAFECEIEVCVFGNHTHYDPKIADYVKPKTTTNSQGQTQLVGTYIYE